MPLRDHFHPPLDDLFPWESFHATWPIMIVAPLRRQLPPRYLVFPRVHSGSSAEVDVATFREEGTMPAATGPGNGSAGGVATQVWAPPRPTLTVTTDLPAQDVTEVRVYDERSGRRLVAAVEIVSPANKDRAEHRQAFVAKCMGLLQESVSVVVVDIVTTRGANLYAELLAAINRSDPILGRDSPAPYAAACRSTRPQKDWLLETWAYPLAVGRPLPQVPLWVADDFAVPLDLEESYE
ncbi:MAG TPA: DUF4058 family protein, partial [Gemmataceae bacterium]|nr:DUF4058 family protein [Gemmataceae bacterium]